MKSTRAYLREQDVRGSIHEQQIGVGPVYGRVRPGVKVLTNKARENAKLQQIFNEGWRVGANFDTIEMRLKQVPGCPPSPLRMANVPWFRLCREDWVDPGDVDKLMELYGEKREGDKSPHLYKFPIMFASGFIDDVFIETFEAWSGRGLLRWSQYIPEEDQVMCCKFRDPDEYEQRGRIQHWGGRDRVLIEPCHPNTCDFYTSGKCQHNGTLLFTIPGITGTGAIRLSFKSIYAKLQIPRELERVQNALGTFQGLSPIDDAPIFWVMKKTQNVARMDWQAGKASRTDQYIIQLVAKGIDMVEAWKIREQRRRTSEIKAGDLPAPRQEPFDMDTAPVVDGGPPTEEDEMRDIGVTISPDDDASLVPDEVLDAEAADEEPPKQPAKARTKKAEEEKAGEPESAETEAKAEPAPKKKTAPKKKSPSPLHDALASRLEKARTALQWVDEDLQEFVEGNYNGQMEDVIQDAGALQAIVEQLESVVERAKQQTKKATPTDSKEGAAEDDSCPF